jgi:acetylornithine deacetylase
MTDLISSAIDRRLPDALKLLMELIAIPTLSGQEESAIQFLAPAFERIGIKPEFQPLPNSIKSDPDYSGLELSLDYDNRHNLIVRLKGNGGGRSALLQTHIDVVPAGDWNRAFTPTMHNDAVFGRGACDCKGQIATIWLALAALQDSGIKLQGELSAQIVVEEEIGGNGALAAILAGDREDAAIVLEPTGMNIHPACRGACWFRISIEGKSVHMGRRHEGVNAIEKGQTVITQLLEYEKKLIEKSRNQPLFQRYEHPVQVCIGMIRGGEWPSMVAGECVIEGGVGFLPNKPMKDVQADLSQLLSGSSDQWIRDHAKIEFPKLHNDAYACDPNHPSVRALSNAAKTQGLPGEIFGWNVSCDARLYVHRAGIPTMVFGPGNVADAHSNHEQIKLKDIQTAAAILIDFLCNWCGTE